MKRLHAVILLALWAVRPALAAEASPEDVFNQERLKSGQELYLDKKYLKAIAQLRVAAFGYLNQTASLSETLVWLSLAQTEAGKVADADATILRFVEVERSFPSYPPAALPPQIQAAFRALLLRRVAEGTLLSIPSLAVLVETKEQKLAKLAPPERRKALEALARSEPNSARWPALLARVDLEQADPKGAERWAAKSLALEAGNAEGLAVRARTRKARGDCAGALADLEALPAGELDKRPELYADQFVCLVELGRWSGAEDARERVPDGLAGRNDVAEAQRKLTSEQQRRVSQTAPAPPAARPPAAPAAKPPAQAAKPAAPAARATAPPASTGPVVRTTPAPTSPARTAAEPSPDDVVARRRAALAESRRLVSAGKPADAERTLNDALKADPGNRDLRLALLEAACLNRSYKTAMAQIVLVEPFSDTEASSLFYAAVVLYESGRPNEARSYLGRAMPNVSGPLVDEYSRKILGQN